MTDINFLMRQNLGPKPAPKPAPKQVHKHKHKKYVKTSKSRITRETKSLDS
jgi:hypothetical protein